MADGASASPGKRESGGRFARRQSSSRWNVSLLAIAEDEPGKEGEAGDAFASSMQPDAAGRSRRQASRYRRA